MRIHPVGLELRTLNNQIMRYFESSPVKQTVDSISGSNGWIICFIADHEGVNIYQRDLEKEFNITRSTASKVVNLMVQKGLIERHSVPKDARLKKLVLTDKALELSSMMRENRDNMERTLVAGFSEEEIDTLCAFIGRMKRNLS